MLGELAIAVFQGGLETMGILSMAIVFSHREINYRKLIPICMVLPLITYLVKHFQTQIGFHTIVSLTIALLYLWKRYELKLVPAFTGMIISFLLLGVLELLFNFIFFHGIGLNQSMFESQPFLWSLIGLPQALVLVLLAFIISRVRVSLVKNRHFSG